MSVKAFIDLVNRVAFFTFVVSIIFTQDFNLKETRNKRECVH